MATYTFYNLLLGIVILTAAYLIAGRNRRILFLAARVALLITLLLYPWDFFAVRLGVWVYPKDPGVMIYGVPLNDSIFIWLCSFLTSVGLLEVDRRNSSNQADTEGHKAVEKNRHNEC
jgi:lycopene cyclase domain-containing protein